MKTNKCIINGDNSDLFENTISGNGNEVTVFCKESAIGKINITINGDDNKVSMDGIRVREALSIYVIGSSNIVEIRHNTSIVSLGISIADNKNIVVIGEDCMISTNVRILASDFHSIYDIYSGIRRNTSRGVRIDNHVWLGYECMVLKNARIRSNSIIGARAVVRGEVGGNTIYTSDHRKATREVTWARTRADKFLGIHHVMKWSKKRINKISNNTDIHCVVENNIWDCLNRIKGYVYWNGKDSKKQEIYLACEMERKYYIVLLDSRERADVAMNENEEKYLWCGFDSFLPAEIIDNAERILTRKIVIHCGNEWGKCELSNILTQ